MESVHRGYVEFREILIDTLLMCGISPKEANEMLDKYEVLILECRDMAKKGDDPISNVRKVGKSKKGGNVDGNSK